MGKTGLEQAKKALVSYKLGETKEMTPELWKAKKIVDSTLHPGRKPFCTTEEYDSGRRWLTFHVDTGEPVLLPFRMSCFVLSNLVVAVGMLTPGLGVRMRRPLPYILTIR